MHIISVRGNVTSDDKIAACCHIDIISGLELPVSHVVFFHVNKGCIMIRFAEAVSISTDVKIISWRYVKNPYYWDKDNVYFDVFEIQVVKDSNTAINLYEAGQLDGVKLSSDYIPQFEGQPDLVKISSLRITNLELVISSNTALQNLNIRKALLYGIDRDELCDAVLNGAATPAVGVIPNGIASSLDGQSVAESFGTLVYTDIPAAQAYFRAGLEELGIDSLVLRLVTSDTDEAIKIGTYLEAAYIGGVVIVRAMFLIPSAIFFETFLSFIGVGMKIPGAGAAHAGRHRRAGAALSPVSA